MQVQMHLHNQRDRRGLVLGMEVPATSEEQTVLGHGVINARSASISPLQQPKPKSYGNRHQPAAWSSKHLRHDGGADAIFSGVLDARSSSVVPVGLPQSGRALR